MCTYSSTTTWDGSTLTPNESCFANPSSGSTTDIVISPSGVTIISVTSNQGLTWSESSGVWTSTCLALATVPGEVVVDISITSRNDLTLAVSQADPTFTVKSKTTCP